MKKEESLLIKNQLCFSLYRLSKFVTANYKQHLDKINLTYPQYLVMLVLWELKKTNMTILGEKLSLDNGTLTPLIKRLIEKELVEKKRCKEDERIVYISTTKKGTSLKRQASNIPEKILHSTEINLDEVKALKTQIDKLYENWSQHE